MENLLREAVRRLTLGRSLAFAGVAERTGSAPRGRAPCCWRSRVFPPWAPWAADCWRPAFGNWPWSVFLRAAADRSPSLWSTMDWSPVSATAPT